MRVDDEQVSGKFGIVQKISGLASHTKIRNVAERGAIFQKFCGIAAKFKKMTAENSGFQTRRTALRCWFH
jgi:hypothetical protein